MTSPNDQPTRRPERPDVDRDLDARLVTYLGTQPNRAPEHLLDAAAVRVHATPQRRRRWHFGGTFGPWVVVAAVLAVVVVASLRFGLGPHPDTAAPGSPTTSVATIGAGRQPTILQRTATSTTVLRVVVLDGNPWAVLVDGLVLRIDPTTGDIVTDLDAQLEEATSAAAGAGAVWIGSLDGELIKVDAATESIARVQIGFPHHAVAANDEAVWVAGTAQAVRVDADTLEQTPFDLPPGVAHLAVVGGEIWATYASGAIVVADGQTGAARATLQLESRSGDANPIMATSPDGLWVTNPDGLALNRIDPDVPEITDVIGFEPPGRIASLAADAGDVWILLGEDGLVVRLDRATHEVEDVIEVGRGARGIGVVPGGLAFWGAGGVQVLDIGVGG